MQKDIIQKIDLLVEMTDTNNHYDTLKEELNILESDIAKQKNQVTRLKKMMSDNRYLNSSDRIIDENIKIGLENKIASNEVILQDVLSEIESISKEEEEYHQMIMELEDEIATSKRFLESLELKLKTIGSKDKSVYTFYEDLIDTTTKEIRSNETRLQVKKKAYEQVESRLASFGESRYDLEEKIKKDSLKLEETKATLENEDSYIDKKAKAKDEEELSRLEEDLDKLEKRHLEIITDPAYIGHEAIDLFLNDDRTSSLAKIKELVAIVNSKPYMDFRYEELDEILDAAVSQRDEFANSLEGKKYDGTDSKILENRILFLQGMIENKKIEKDELEKKIRQMDVDYVRELMEYIADAKHYRDKLKQDIEEYKSVMEENTEYKSPKKKASLNAAFHRKTEELDAVYTMIDSYEKDLEQVVEESKNLEENVLGRLQSELKDMEAEVKKYEKKKILGNAPVDILAMEKDKSELKKLSDEVSLIQHRKKYLKTPNEIFDEIEMSFSSTMEEEKVPEKEAVDLNDYRIDVEEETEEEPKEISLHIDDEELDEKEEEPPILEDVDDSSSLDSILEEKEISFPPRNSIKEEENPNLFKVVSVEPLEEEAKNNSPENDSTSIEKEEPIVSEEVSPVIEESKEEVPNLEVPPIQDDDYMVNDFDDTDYISFNDLLEGSMNNADKN